MSITIQQILSDAKKLAGRLKERDSVADMLLNEAHAINKKIDSMKQYQEEVEVLNEVARHKPHAQLIASVQQNNMRLREIQQENLELKAALEDHQTAMGHIMNKYRQHTSKQIYDTRINFHSFQNSKYSEIIKKQAEKINEMAAVMQRAANLDEDGAYKKEEIVSMLKLENRGLREMLNIANKFGNNDSPIAKETEDKQVQTDSVVES